MMKFFDGNNSFIGIIAFGFYNMAVHFFPMVANIVSPEVANTVILTWTGWAFRRAIKKVE